MKQYLIRLDELLFMSKKKIQMIKNPFETFFLVSLSIIESILLLVTGWEILNHLLYQNYDKKFMEKLLRK